MYISSRHIYINARFLLRQATGVERYAYEISRALVKLGADVTFVCPKNGRIHHRYDVSNFHIIRFGLGSSHIWDQMVLPFFFLNKKNYLLLSLTGLGSIMVKQKVMTIHDLSFLYNPSWFSKSYYYFYKLLTPIAVRTSQKIITVSEFSKNEILRFYDFIAPEKIGVIYNAVDRDTFVTTPCHNDNEKYFLLVSSLDPRKNIKFAIEAFRRMKDCKLKIVGGANKVFGNANGVCDLPSNIKLLGRADDNELVALYSGATAFLFPSFYEGFGIPPLEAMACNCPVLSADIPVLREVCRDAALYFSTENVDELCEAIQTILNMSPQDRASMIDKGTENLSRFSWEQSALKLINYLTNE